MHNHPGLSASAKRRGAAALELAICLPLLVLLVFGCVDLGRAVHVYIALGNATRCGAERGAMQNYTSYTEADWRDSITESVREELADNGWADPNAVSVTIDTEEDADELFRVSVATSYPFRLVTNIPGLPRELTLRHMLHMRQIR